MTAVTDTQIDEVQSIERCLDELLKVAIATKQPWPSRNDRPRPVGQLAREFLGSTRAQNAAREFFDNPVGEAARQGVRVMGERLHEIGGIKLMQDVLYRVSDQGYSGSDRDRRIGIMDHRWSGIGTWMA